MTSLDPTAVDRLIRWRDVGDVAVTYTAGSKQFGDDVIVVLDDIKTMRAAMRDACDLLAERTHGSPARSPAHNARLRLEATLD